VRQRLGWAGCEDGQAESGDIGAAVVQKPSSVQEGFGLDLVWMPLFILARH
jgi:hypothetical protein